MGRIRPMAANPTAATVPLVINQLAVAAVTSNQVVKEEAWAYPPMGVAPRVKLVRAPPAGLAGAVCQVRLGRRASAPLCPGHCRQPVGRPLLELTEHQEDRDKVAEVARAIATEPAQAAVVAAAAVEVRLD